MIFEILNYDTKIPVFGNCCKWNAGSPALKLGRGRRFRVWKSSLSASTSGFGVVSSLSPAKMLFAPARKHRACSSVFIRTLPADRRTMAFGMMIRAVAIIRTISQTETRGCSARGVPSTGTRAFTGTDSGCSGRQERVCNMPILSSWVSPMPMMPPLQTDMPDLRTFSRVSNLSP